MTRRVLATMAVSFALAAGCAKQPATMPMSAPAPGGVGGMNQTPNSPPSGSTSATADARPSTATSGTRDAGRAEPKQFRPVAELSDIYFDFDRYELTPSAQRALQAHAAWLKSYANAFLLIEGHCDERGTTEHNLALGERRAKATLNYLVSRGVDVRRMTVVSYGEQRPQCSDPAEACWAKNRRAHFLARMN